MKIRALLILMLLSLVAYLSAQANNFQVIYIDGQVEAKSATTWAPLQIGDLLTAQSQVRLAKGAKLELAANGNVIAIFKPGVFGLAAIAAERQNGASRNVGNLISQRLAKFTSTSNPRADQGGVRGELVQGSLQKSASEEYNTSMQAGFDAIQSGRPAIAYNHFRDAMDMGVAGMQIQAAVFAAQSAIVLGRAAQALDCLNGLEPARDDALLPMFYLSRAQAALQGMDIPPAISDFELVAQSPISTNDLRQEALIGLGICAQSQGDAAKAKQLWHQAVDLNPQSDQGISAAQLIK